MAFTNSMSFLKSHWYITTYSDKKSKLYLQTGSLSQLLSLEKVSLENHIGVANKLSKSS